MKSSFKKVIRLIKIVYTPLSFVFLFYFTWLNRQLIVEILRLSNGVFLFYAILFWSFLHFLSPLAPKIVFTNLGYPFTYKQMLSIHIQQIPARYLPGGVWHTVGRMTAYHLSGASKKMVAFYALIETVAPCIVTLLLGGFALWISEMNKERSFIFGSIALIQLFIIFLIPLIAKLHDPNYLTLKSVSAYCFFLFISFFYWFIATSSFLFYYQAFSLPSFQFGITEQIHIIGSYLFSWGIGYVAVFAPQGIGVFEVVAGKLMKLPMDIGGAVVFMAGFRLIALAADIGVWCLYKSCFILRIFSQ